MTTESTKKVETVEVSEKPSYKGALKSGAILAGKALGSVAVQFGSAAVMGYVMGKVVTSGMKEMQQRRDGTQDTVGDLREANDAINKARDRVNA